MKTLKAQLCILFGLNQLLSCGQKFPQPPESADNAASSATKSTNSVNSSDAIQKLKPSLENAALSLEFFDTNFRGGKLEGNVFISPAANETELTDYVLYWGSGPSSKLPNQSPIAVMVKQGTRLKHSFPPDTTKPSDATHLLVFTKNAEGEMPTGTSVLLEDKGLPNHAAVGISFTDTDLDGGQLAGKVSVGKASDETTLTQYTLYWGNSETSKLIGQNPIAIWAKQSTEMSHSFSKDSRKPLGASHLLVFTKNADGEMSTGSSILIMDKGLPTQSATSVAFSDIDSDGGQLSGIVAIGKASDETSLTHYSIYWGNNDKFKLSGQNVIAVLEKQGTNISHTLTDNTIKPFGATHFLVFTKNKDGEMAMWSSVLIEDKGVPNRAASAISFSDSDLNGGQLEGLVSIEKATNESSLTHYVIYWGESENFKLTGHAALVSLEKRDANLTFSFPKYTAKPSDARYLLVFTKNSAGEMAHGMSAQILDRGAPTEAALSISFTDTDLRGGQLGGTVSITKAMTESNLSEYSLYWGSSESKKLLGQSAIAVLAKQGRNLSFSFSNTSKPAAATHLIVFTKNADGEMPTGQSVLIIDRGVPVQTAESVTFLDVDPDGGEVSGVLTIGKATSEKLFSLYILYWGSNESTKLSGHNAIAVLYKKGVNVTHSFPDNTPKPTNASHLLVFTANEEGEMAAGVAAVLWDNALPTAKATKVTLSDSNMELNVVSGAVLISRAVDESSLSHYAVYLSTKPVGSTVVQRTLLKTLAKTGEDLEFSISDFPFLSESHGHLEVVSKNASGEMASGAVAQVIDVGRPTIASKIVGFEFEDFDSREGFIQGQVKITANAHSHEYTDYVFYWGSDCKNPLVGIKEVGVIAKNQNVYEFTEGTVLPHGAKYLLVARRNVSLESSDYNCAVLE